MGQNIEQLAEQFHNGQLNAYLGGMDEDERSDEQIVADAEVSVDFMEDELAEALAGLTLAEKENLYFGTDAERQAMFAKAWANALESAAIQIKDKQLMEAA